MKEYTKKAKGKGHKITEVNIENNLKGLYDYLTAPNIRKKTKSILFFLLRFSSCFKAYITEGETEGVTVNFPVILEKRYTKKVTFSSKRGTRRASIHSNSRRSKPAVFRVHQDNIPGGEVFAEQQSEPNPRL